VGLGFGIGHRKFAWVDYFYYLTNHPGQPESMASGLHEHGDGLSLPEDTEQPDAKRARTDEQGAAAQVRQPRHDQQGGHTAHAA
jgi:hypothetical protein